MARLKNTDFVYFADYQSEKAADVRVPGSKSITNRALLIASLAKGRSVLRKPLLSQDTEAMRDCLSALGVSTTITQNLDFTVSGLAHLSRPTDELFVRNAGTAARFLTAAAAIVDGAVTLDGDGYMRERPIGPLIEALEELGLKVKSNSGYMPLTVSGQKALQTSDFCPIVTIDASYSSQYVSALMMIGPMLPRGLDLRLQNSSHIDAAGYLDVTIDTMKSFGITPAVNQNHHWVFRPAAYKARDFEIEPDYSACTYFWAAQELCPTVINIEGTEPLSTRQPDAKSIDLIRTFPRMPSEIDGSQMQDAVPTLAVLAAFNRTPVRFHGISNLRVKECDRISAIQNGLNQVRSGLAIVNGDDLTVSGGLNSDRSSTLIRIDSCNDHRIAMAFALLALRRSNIAITNPQCVAKTFPSFWTEFAKLGAKMQFFSHENYAV